MKDVYFLITFLSKYVKGDERFVPVDFYVKRDVDVSDIYEFEVDGEKVKWKAYFMEKRMTSFNKYEYINFLIEYKFPKCLDESLKSIPQLTLKDRIKILEIFSNEFGELKEYYLLKYSDFIT